MFMHFHKYYTDWFPALRQITRTIFNRQAANLWKVKQELWQMLAHSIPHDRYISIVDSFPVPVIRFARATYCCSFGEVATYGYDEVTRQIDCGSRAHVHLAWPGVVLDCARTPAHLSDTEAAEAILHGVAGFVLADRNYWKPDLAQRLNTYGLYMLAPYKSTKHQKQPYPRSPTHIRYRIEIVSGQLVERVHAKRVWARDLGI